MMKPHFHPQVNVRTSHGGLYKAAPRHHSPPPYTPLARVIPDDRCPRGAINPLSSSYSGEVIFSICLPMT